MALYCVLSRGEQTEFACERSEVERLLNSGFEKIGEVNSSSLGAARYAYENRKSHEKCSVINTNYLKLALSFFLLTAVLAVLILIRAGLVSLGDESFFYYAGAAACAASTMLIHSVCKVVIKIAQNIKPM